MPISRLSKVVASFDFERETKHKMRFEERGEPDNHAVGKLYLAKTHHQKLGEPESLRVTIEPTPPTDD
jgi:hypothetical protein